SFNWDNAFFNNPLSTFLSKFFVIISTSVPSTSDNNNSFPSQSIFNVSSKDISVFNLLFFLKYIKFSFLIHRDAYVASLFFFSGLNVLTALFSPMVPILIRSSILIPVFSNFRAIYTTKRKLRSINTALADLSPLGNNSSSSFSSSFDNGGGSAALPPM